MESAREASAAGSHSPSWDARLYQDRHAFVWQLGSSLLELLATRPGERILDLGCGTGQLTAQIAQAGAEVIGLDQSPAMIEEARRHFPDIHFEIADARSLGWTGAFDAVFSNAVLHWIPEAALVAEGIARALKPGGRFVAEFGGKGNVQELIDAVQAALQAIGCAPVASPWYYPSVGEYATVLERTGLEVTFATLFDRPTPLEGESGLRHWFEMFGHHFIAQVPAERRECFFQQLQEAARPTLHREGTWVADYRRLRVLARKAPARKRP